MYNIIKIQRAWIQLCARSMTENQHWMHETFRLSSCTVLKTDTILSWKWLHGVGNTSRNVTAHTSPCHPQMQVKALSRGEGAVCEHDPETAPSSLLSFKIDRADVGNCCVVKWIKFFGKSWTKEERDHPVCYQRSVQKSASLMVWGHISAYATDN